MTTGNHNIEGQAPGKSAQKGDKIEVVRILILALVSFVLGFGLVIFFLSPTDDSKADDLSPAIAAGADESASQTEETADKPPEEKPAPAAGYAPNTTENPLIANLDDNATAEGMADEADAPVEIPPGRTPDGVAIDGDAFYLKCWDGEGQEQPGSSCDPLRVLEKRFATRLYVVNKCREKFASGKEGKLSLGVEVDFDNNALSFWNGGSSTLENAGQIATCLRSELKGLPIHSVTHKLSKYRLFFTILFGKGGNEQPPAEKTATASPEAPPTKLPKGKMVNVVKDRVRVRKTPVDGEELGKISSGNQVLLLKKKGDWCNVRTPNENEGWMICDALEK